jgi:hypothetical protein
MVTYSTVDWIYLHRSLWLALGDRYIIQHLTCIITYSLVSNTQLRSDFMWNVLILTDSICWQTGDICSVLRCCYNSYTSIYIYIYIFLSDLFYSVAHIDIREHWMVEWVMNLKESSCDLIEVLSSNLPGKTEESNEKSRVASIPAKIPTEHLSNTSLEHYTTTQPTQ